MAQSDVELRISARDDASDNLARLKESLNDFVDSTSSAAKKALESDSQYQKLTKTVKDLADGLAALKTQSDAADTFSKQEAKVDGLAKALSETEQELSELNDAFNTNKSALSSNESTISSYTNEISILKTKLSDLKAEQKAYASDESLIKKLGEERSALSSLDDKYESTRKALDAIAKEKAAYGQQVDSLNNRISNHMKLINALEKEYGDANKQTKQQKAEISQLRSEYDFLVRNLNASNRAVKDLNTEQDKLTRSLDKTAQAMDKSEGKISELESELQGYGNSLQDVNRVEQLRQQSLAQIEQEMNDAKSSLDRYESALSNLAAENKTLTTEQAKLVKSISQTEVKVDELAKNFNQAAETLDQFEKSARDAGVDVANLATEHTRLKAEVAKAAQELKESKSLLNGYAKEFIKVDQQARKAGKSISVFGDDTRKAMSLGQRFRGELISMATAYVGLYGVINGITKSIDAYTAKQTFMSRMTVVLGDDTRAMGEEMEYVGRVADELKLPLDVLRDNYSKLYVAMRQQGESAKDVKEIFEGISTAARVMNMSSDDTAGVFRALTQIMGKGKIMAEELTQQLGDRFPNATALMAKSLDVSTEKLFKMMAAGELSSERLLDFAKLVKEEYSGGLAASLANFQAQVVGLGNEFIKLQETVGQKLAERLTEPVNRLTEALQKGDIANHLDGIVEVVGKLADGFVFLVENIDVVIATLEALLNLAIIQYVAKFTTSIINIGKEFVEAGKKAKGLGNAIKALPLNIKIAVAVLGFELASAAIDYLMKKAAGVEEANRKIRQSELSLRDGLYEVYLQQRDNLEALKEFKDVQILSTKEVANLSAEELELYVQRLEGHKEYNDKLQHSQHLAKQLGIETKGQAEAAAKGLENVKKGYENIDNAAQQISDGVNPVEVISENAEKLIKVFDDAREGADSAEKGIKAILDEVEILDKTEFVGFGESLDELYRKGQITAEEMRSAWDTALGRLSADSLSTFAMDAKKTFGETERGSRMLAESLDSVLRVQFEKLGLTFEQVLGTRLSQTSINAIANIRGVQSALTVAGVTGVERFNAVESAINSAIDQADNTAALSAISTEIASIAKSGDLAAGATGRLNARIYEQQQKLDSLTPGIQSANEAYRNLGMNAPQGLQNIAAANRESYDYLVKSGVEIDKVRDAFLVYAESAIAANEGVIDATLEEEAAKLGLTESLEALLDAQQNYSAKSEEAINIAEDEISIIEQKTAAMEAELEIMLELAEQKKLEAEQKEDMLEADKELLDSEKEMLEAQLAVAEAEGNEIKIKEIKIKLLDIEVQKAKKDIEIAKQRVEVAKQAIQYAKAEVEASKAKQQAAEKELKAQQNLLKEKKKQFEEDGKITDAEREALSAIEAKIAGAEAEIIVHKGKIDAGNAEVKLGEKQVKIAENGVKTAEARLKTEEQARDAAKKTIEETSKAQDENSKELEKNTEATKKNSKAKSDSSRSSGNLSTATNNATTATQNNTDATNKATQAIEEQAVADDFAAKVAEERAAAEEQAAASIESRADAEAAATEAHNEAAQAAQNHAQKLMELANEALGAHDALQDLNSTMERELYQATEQYDKIAELGYKDRVKQIESLYLKTGEMGSDTHKEAMDRANELYKLELDSLLEKGSISKKQYKESLGKVSEISEEAKTQALFEKEKADTLRAQQDAIASMTQGAEAMAASFRIMTAELKEMMALMGVVDGGEGAEGRFVQGASNSLIGSAKQADPKSNIKTVKIELPSSTGTKSINVMPGEEDVFQSWITGVLKGRATA
jgi:tape measure domain-containing protein